MLNHPQPQHIRIQNIIAHTHTLSENNWKMFESCSSHQITQTRAILGELDCAKTEWHQTMTPMVSFTYITPRSNNSHSHMRTW